MRSAADYHKREYYIYSFLRVNETAFANGTSLWLDRTHNNKSPFVYSGGLAGQSIKIKYDSCPVWYFHHLQSRCVYPKWASTTWTPHTYTVTSFSLASAYCILPFRSDPASYRFWSGSVVLSIGLLSFTVCLQCTIYFR